MIAPYDVELLRDIVRANGVEPFLRGVAEALPQSTRHGWLAVHIRELATILETSN